MGKLPGQDRALPLELGRIVGELPLASPALREVGTCRSYAVRGRFEHSRDLDASPRSLVDNDVAFDPLARHGAGDKMGLAFVAGNGLAAVSNVNRGEFHEADSGTNRDPTSAVVSAGPERAMRSNAVSTILRSPLLEVELPETPTAEQVFRHAGVAAEKVAHSKQIRLMELVAEIPKSALGKILRRVSRDRERAVAAGQT
jgi:hypothetical protein